MESSCQSFLFFLYIFNFLGSHITCPPPASWSRWLFVWTLEDSSCREKVKEFTSGRKSCAPVRWGQDPVLSGWEIRLVPLQVSNFRLLQAEPGWFPVSFLLHFPSKALLSSCPAWDAASQGLCLASLSSSLFIKITMVGILYLFKWSLTVYLLQFKWLHASFIHTPFLNGLYVYYIFFT